MEDDGLPWWIWIVIALVALLFCCCCGFGVLLADRRRRRREKEEMEKRSVLYKERDLESGMDRCPPPVPKADSPIPIVQTTDVSVNNDYLVEIPVENSPERPGTVGLLWGGNNEDSMQELTSERIALKRKSEKLTREQLTDKLNHRSFTMPLEEVHEGGGDEDDDDDNMSRTSNRSNRSNRSVRSFKSTSSLHKSPSSRNSRNANQLADSAVDYHFQYDEQPSAVHPPAVEGMSIKELKSFIVDNGGDLEGCIGKDQLLARAKELT